MPRSVQSVSSTIFCPGVNAPDRIASRIRRPATSTRLSGRSGVTPDPSISVIVRSYPS
ncbi:Uncharacterised protein [Mycobacteroides abscessus subsp. abscessus]|nr:Uncharacterised protein [Mycobacteroides abscessus subsp. abscessus]